MRWTGLSLFSEARRPSMRRFFIACVAFCMAARVSAAQEKHAPFNAHDWTELRDANPAAVSENGTILYTVTYGGEKGPTRTEWWVTGSDGNNAKKLDVPDGFHPMGFT